MKTTNVSILYVVLIVLSAYVCADVIHIPDPNLERVLREAMELQPGDDITKERMAELDALDAPNQGIKQLVGIEHAVSLQDLRLPFNEISDLMPLASLTRLKRLYLYRTLVSDLSPLRGLIQLEDLDLSGCKIVDISPLSNLKALAGLNLRINRITDVRPLATLANLDVLFVDQNLINDHSPLDGLSLDLFRYDQFCEMEPLPLDSRLGNRNFPNIPGAEWLVGQDSRLDLMYGGGFFGMYPRADGRLAGDFERGLKERDEFITANPNAVFLIALLAMKGAGIDYWGEEWPYWVRDSDGDIVPDHPLTPDIGLVDFTQPEVQDLIVQQAISVSKCGLFDGIVFDWWREESGVLRGYVSVDAQLQARLNILRRIRAATRPNFLIQVNSNWVILPKTGKYINGLSMETGIPRWGGTPAEREELVVLAERAITWAEEHLREPRINSIFGDAFHISDEPDTSANASWVRLLTTLSLTHSDGYATIQHLDLNRFDDRHWHDFWNVDLGRPVGEKRQLYDEDIPGVYIREFTNGWAVYNHSGAAQVITLPEEAQGVASGLVNTEHELPNLDGEMYLRAKPPNPADVNGDGVVNILDLVAVAQSFGTDGLQGDVNGDRVVNVFDLVFVAGEIGGGGAAPSAYSPDLSIISAVDVERWLTDAQGLGVGDANFQRGIRFLEGLLAALTPKETMLLPNYPNPFNPETWIPYRLAREAKVAITIYDTKGTLVRQLALGNLEAGYYAERGKAAYWDGRNEDGEAVASGIYIYQFQAGDYAASRRMVIVK